MKSQAKRGGATGQGPRVGHLDTLGGVLAEASAVYREMRLGKIKHDKGRSLIWSLSQMREMISAMVL